MRSLSTLVLFFLSFSLFSQSELPRSLECGHDRLVYPEAQRSTLDSLEVAYRDWLIKYFAPSPREGGPPADRSGNQDFATSKSSSSPPPFVLPIVFHVIHQNGTELLDQARIEQSLDYLNQSFANTDYYDQGTGVNTQIQFCLAERTPDNQFTTGVTYHEDALTDLNSNDDLAMKNLARWAPRDYINVYVVREICGLGLGCGVAGYAYYPSAHGSGVDGIVVEARWLGLNEANNSVLTHEMGHYLGLRHTFDGGCVNDDCLLDGDRVCDTPPDQSTAAVPCGATANSCDTDTDSGFSTDQNDLYNNYMDYGLFGCYNALTAGQADRMYFFIDGIRNSLLESPACLEPCTAPVDAAFSPSDPGPILTAGTSVNFTNTSTNATTYEWYVNGVLVATTQDFSFTFSTEGTYSIRLVAQSDSPLCGPSETQLTYTVQCQLSAGFTVSNDQPAQNDLVDFTATDPGADVYNWTVNGATVSVTQTYTHTFSAPGLYQVCLSVRQDSCVRESCRNFYISPPFSGDGCFGPTYLSLFGLGQDGGNITGTAIRPDGNGGLWQTAALGSGILLQHLDVVGNVLSARSFSIDGLANPAVRSMARLSDGSLLLAGFGNLSATVRGSFLLRYDPVADAVIYLRQLQTRGSFFSLVPIPNQADRFLCLQGVDVVSTTNGSNEYWLFDVEGLTGNVGTLWNQQSNQAGPHSIYSGIFRQGQFWGTGRIGVTAAVGSFRSCVINFTQPNAIDELQLLHRPSSSIARLYGSQLLEAQQSLYALHWGNQSGTTLNSNSFVYFNRFSQNNTLAWTREIRNADATLVVPRGMVYDNGTFYLVGSLTETNVGARLFVLALNTAGQVQWSNTYATPDGILLPGISAAGESLIVTNDRLIISASYEPTVASGGPGAAALLQINLDGSIDDECVSVIPLGMTSELVDGSLEDFQMNTVAGSTGNSAIEHETQQPDYPRYTACLDTCQNFVEEICDNGIDDDNNGATDCEDPALADSCCCRSLPTVVLPADTSICDGTALTLTAQLSGDSLGLEWSTGSTDTFIVVDQAGTYVLEITDDCGNAFSDTIVVTLIPPADPPELGPDTAVCDNGVFELDAGPGYQSYRWSDLTTEQMATFYEPGTYGVTVTDGCANTFTDEITIDLLPTTQLDLPATLTICPEDSLTYSVNGFETYQWFPQSVFPCADCSTVTIYPPASGDTLLLTLVATTLGNGCISVDSILVIGGSEEGTYVEAMLCEGEQYAFNDTLLTTSGLYYRPAFCGGTDTLALTVNSPPPVTSLSAELCQGDSLLIFGQFQRVTGLYVDTLTALNGCDSIVQFQLNVFEPPTSSETFTICAGDSLEIFGSFQTQSGVYTASFPLSNSPCDSVATVVLNVTPLPSGTVTVATECGQPTADVVIVPADLATIIDWQDPGISGFTPELGAGEYHLALFGPSGCRLDTTISIFIPPAVDVDFLVIDPICPETAGGSILLSPPATGTLVNLDGQDLGTVDSIGGLSAGRYELSYTDSSGCSGNTQLMIEDPAGFQIILPRDTILRLGNRLTIRGRIFGLSEDLATVVWSPADYLDCDSCLIVSSQPVASITYSMTVTDTLGCSRTDDIRISLDRRERVYLPNAFSPNGDGINDEFFPNGGPEVESVELLQIFDRWGEMVFEQTDFPPNDPAYGWDGTFRQKRLNPQVFVYQLRLRLIDGTLLSLAGDLTLLR